MAAVQRVVSIAADANASATDDKSPNVPDILRPARAKAGRVKFPYFFARNPLASRDSEKLKKISKSK
jgi:hypothetical protein